MRFLTEELPHEVRMLEEAVGDKKRYYIEGTFAQAEVVNRNKRKYPLEVLENEINRYLNENVKKNSAWGELNHPQGPNINADRIAIRIVDLKKEGTDFPGKALITPTPMGDIVRGLQESGGRLGVSTRALGSVKPISEGINEVQKDLRLLAIDVVTDPSAPNAYVNSIMENKEWAFNPALGIWVEQLVETQKEIIKETPSKELDEVKLALWESFLQSQVNKPKIEDLKDTDSVKAYIHRFIKK